MLLGYLKLQDYVEGFRHCFRVSGRNCSLDREGGTHGHISYLFSYWVLFRDIIRC